MEWWAWMLILIAPVGYLRLVAHELSHACTQVVLGGKVRAILKEVKDEIQT